MQCAQVRAAGARGLGSACSLQSAGTGAGKGTAQRCDHVGQSIRTPHLHWACRITIQVHVQDWQRSMTLPGRVREHQHVVCTRERMPRPTRACHTCAAGAPLPAAAQARAAGRARCPTCGEVTTIVEECHVMHWQACSVQVHVVTLHGYVSGCCLQRLCRPHCQSMAENSQTHCYVSTTCCTSNLLCSTFCVPALWRNRAYYYIGYRTSSCKPVHVMPDHSKEREVSFSSALSPVSSIVVHRLFQGPLH
jgi:hypothetical protein